MLDGTRFELSQCEKKGTGSIEMGRPLGKHLFRTSIFIRVQMMEYEEHPKKIESEK